jgi:lysophospholipase L1-like esterase
VSGNLRLDLFVDGQPTDELSLEAGTTNASFKSLGGDWKRVEIFLDQGQPFNLQNVVVDDGAAIKKTLVTQKRWVTYGSSITHAGSAKRPSQIWPTLVAQKLDLHLTTFGFSGNCQSEPMIGRIIRDMPADFITLKLGINSHGGALSARTFGSNVIGLIQIIREKHQETPMALISPIYSPPRESEKGGSGLSLQDMREIHEGIAASCLKYGDRNLYYVDGLKVFGPDELKYLPDELHPDADGQFVMAENFVREVFGRFPS